MNKKYMYIGLQVATLLVVVFAGYALFGKTKNKSLLMVVDKVYTAYSDFISDLGTSPENIKDLYTNANNNINWNGPYISEKLLADHSEGAIEIIKASLIPTKNCALESVTNCYTWISVNNISNGSYSNIKEELSDKTAIFYANNTLFFKITQAE